VAAALPTEDVIELPEGVDLEEEIPEELSMRHDFLVEGYCYEVVALGLKGKVARY